MKRMIFVLAIIVSGMGNIFADGGTYRIYSANRSCIEPYYWLVRRDSPSPSGPKVAVIVTNNIWDTIMSEYGLRPVPWQRSYDRDQSKWISWSANGRDTEVPDPDSLNPATWGYYTYYSPGFKIFDRISRATIWIACDDIVS